MGFALRSSDLTYAFDSELAPWVAGLPKLRLDHLEAARRTETGLMAQLPRYEPPVPVDVRDAHVPTEPGRASQVPLRIYQPKAGVRRLPGLLYMHPGGFVLGSIEGSEADAIRIAATVGVVVISVGYRLAPEHPYPAALEDSYAALRWVATHADDLNVDGSRVGVAGESAGAGLAAAVALLARDRKGPPLCFQSLVTPALDDRQNTYSARRFTDTPFWHRGAAKASWDHYLGGAGARSDDGQVSAYAAPARASDLSGLPPAYVTACEFDPVRDEGLCYAQRLIQSGVATELCHFPGTFHASAALVPGAQVSRRMLRGQLEALRRGLHGALPPSGLTHDA